jgi:hypothetical protein
VMEVPYAHEDQCRSCHIAIKGLISYDLSRQRTETGNFPPLILTKQKTPEAFFWLRHETS